MGNSQSEGLEELLAVLRTARDRRVHVGYEEAAHRLGVSEKWLRERIATLPHRKMGKYVLFSHEDIAAISSMFAVCPPEGEPDSRAGSASISDLKPSRAGRRHAA
ncbi:DNA-binding protein [Streptomyces sp. AJS327]|uniref:helix-turn-helix domain-containing protein n=1 Tax=Streptomyces sp. AJS327 TaxID=2545265 RepID=UPI0015DDCE0D|nr:helix-turn-helix domain-containing protein [Streptomyces sp. AJS327]MBA0053668.1 DNA-binding protein [Streptomyces sp. AJS327]